MSEYELREPIRVTGRDGGYIIAWPSDRFEVSCTNANHLGKHTQFRTWNPETGNYAKEIALARTFVFYEEVQPLMEKGLIKGGSLENAVVIRGDAILSREPLRYEDEFVRHKILDIIGDLSLFPGRLKAHIYAVKPSHALNVELAREIYKQYKQRQAAARADREHAHRRGRRWTRGHHEDPAAPLSRSCWSTASSASKATRRSSARKR